jgi:GT2 family glycosyltransferase
VADQYDSIRELEAELNQLRQLLLDLRKQFSATSDAQPQGLELVETGQDHLYALQRLVRSLSSGEERHDAKQGAAQREIWDLKVRRADLTARLKERDRLLEQIQNSISWKAVKPIWKLFHRSQRRKEQVKTAIDDLVFDVDLPKEWKTTREIILIKGWCFSRAGRSLAGVRVKIGTKSKLARYGLNREELAGTFRGWPAALQSGFTIELPVPVGVSTVRLEVIEQGSGWQPFFEHTLEREGRKGDSPKPAAGRTERDRVRRTHGILKLPPLSARKAFDLLQSGFQKHDQRRGTGPPLISVITPAFNSRPEWIADAGLSLLNQSLPNWEWCLVDDGSDNSESRKLIELLRDLSPALQVKLSTNGGISAATNQAVDVARGGYVCFLDHDDLLEPSALELMIEKLSEGYDVAYSDEDKLDDATGELVEPFHKPGWSPEYLRGVMYVGHLLCVKTELARKIRFDPAFDGVQDFEFMLRLSETGAKIGHIAQALYHWRKTPGSIAEKPDAKPEIGLLQARAVNAHLERLNLPAQAAPSNLPHRLKITPAPRESFSKISVIIPNRDAPEVFGRCLESIHGQTSYQNFEVIVMDNDTSDERAVELMRKFPVRRVPFPGKFNFSRANNQGAEAASGEFLVFLNNDTEVMTKDWLEQLLYYAEQKDVGAVGALLTYDDRTVQHAGVALGMRGTADHVMRRFPIDGDGYAGSLACAREVTAVTAACLMMRASLFRELGGFNEHYFTAYQDVDLCLRLRARGLRIIYTPQAQLVHHESVSRQSYYDMIDRMLLLDQWEHVIERGDPYYNPNLNLQRGDYSLEAS